ncbi:MAG: HAMP domain-containing protein [Aeromicrobium sp.]|nr:HAMP domain-containing protein [Burkholderiales bacterium]
MKMFQKMMLAPLVAILFATASAATGWWAIAQQEAALEQLSQKYLEARRLSNQLRFQLATARADGYWLFTVQSNFDEAKAKAERTKITAGLTESAKIVDDVQKRVVELDDAIFKSATKLINAYNKKADMAIDMASVDINTGIAAMMSADDQYKATIASVEVMAKAVSKAAADHLEAASKLAARSKLIMMISGGIASFAALILAWIISRRFTQRIGVVIDASNRLADNDLSVKIHDDGKDEVAQVATALERMRVEMASIIANIHMASENVSTASSEIAQGNADLSSRTESQAGSLQQTASSVEQLTGTVRNSADNAKQASVLAASASSVAMKGGDAVNQVVSTMSEIQDSSKKISDIIGVIDGIAFQTNILALNAAVEAARAGEQGRGFAVVAGEVRVLAQRSAQAAKEIKVLISNSVDKVNSGTRQVADAGATMQEIVAQVKRVNNLIEEITAATTEQAGGIEQVNQAVTSLDQVTQQNAALVEQSAAAAASLKDQALALNEAVSVFKLHRHTA